eukprot:g17709.t1
MADRDRVQMKEQILRGLLHAREDGDGTHEVGGAAGLEGGALSTDVRRDADESRRRREDLVKTGAVTPLDVLDELAVGLVGKRRKTLQDYKIAEGMTVKLPRSRSAKIRPRTSRSDLSECRREFGGETGNVDYLQGGLGEAAEDDSEYSVECPLCAQHVQVDDPANPDVSISKHMDRCSRSSRRKSCHRLAGEDCVAGSGAAASAEDGAGNRKGGSNIGDGEQAHDEGRGRSLVDASRRSATEAAKGVHTSSAKSKDKGKKPEGAKRQKALSQASSPEGEKNAVKVLGGGQPLVDDFEDADFETRKARILGASLGNGLSDDSTAGLGSNPSELENGLNVDRGIAERLFQFQLTGVRWMWQLHRQGAGGIIGDEMGLGKTVQVSAFLGALHGSNVMRRALIVCPATVLSHWMAELHVWAPHLRVVLLHRCAQAFNAVSGSSGKLRALIRRVLGWPHVVVVTSYEGMKSLKALLLPCNWDYCVLDEGQRIRNPDAEVTLMCKQIRTVHRLVLTGTPIQNNLRELWSLFDFVFPGRLGTLPAFEAEFANPIRVGGYANASPMQARLAYRCALVLRDLINPYLLRRQKKDLEDIIHLPAKTEQVLFCRLTSYQRRLYAEFLESTEVKGVLTRTTRAFRAIGILRKLCNHPDLVCRFGDSVVTRLALHRVWGGTCEGSESGEDDLVDGSKDDTQGQVQRSGKLLVLQQILPLWREQGHRVLLFSQTRQMLNIIERFVQNNGWPYGRLDGSTPVGTRQTLIDRFNTDDSIFVMLLTTRTGGVGVNLTGADRVILFDPDWNPSTDMQARERSWRVGQLRQVTVYRLVTAGTIEEKIYHRQIFKTALTNRVLQDPKQRRMFSADDLRDLFTLGDDGALDGFTGTVDLFQGEGRIDAPKGKQRGAGRGRSAANVAHRKHPRKANLEPEGGEGGGRTSSEGDREGEKSMGDNNAVLQALFDGAPLSSVFHHDVAEGSGMMTVEQKRMEEAAKRAAQRAVNQLRMSRHTLRAGAGQGGFQSSWTGRNGGVSAGTPSQSVGQVASTHDGARRRFGTVSNPRAGGGPSARTVKLGVAAGQSISGPGHSGSAGLSSQDILRQIRLRNGNQPALSGLFPEFEDASASNDKDAYFAALLQRLQDYLAQAPSGVDTAALIHAFGDVPAGDVPIFRQLLQAVATCSNGEWTLRDAPHN